MNRYFSGRFQRDICVIYPGEMFVSNEDIFIGTVLGSCISIALFDETQRLGGLNHFMLPSGSMRDENEEVGRYGDYAIELLINEMMKKGAKKESLVPRAIPFLCLSTSCVKRWASCTEIPKPPPVAAR